MLGHEKSFNQEWEVIHSKQEWGMYPTEHVIRFVARNYYNTNRENTKVLDFGCGTGAHAWYLAREGFDTYGFDGSQNAIHRAEHRFRHEGLSAHFQVADALDINYPDDFFDAVIDNVCILGNLVDNINKMYENVYRMLKPGGKLLSTCFGKKTDGYGTGDALEKDTYVNITEGAMSGRGTIHFFDQSELKELLEKVGFIDIQMDTVLYTDRGVQIEQYITVAQK